MKLSKTHLTIHAESIGDRFMLNNVSLKKFHAPKLKSVGNWFMYFNKSLLTNFHAPKLKIVGDDFLFLNTSLTQLHAPELKSVGFWFMSNNEIINKSKFTLHS